MTALDLIAEAKIAEALRDGDFSDLPGTGKPLALDDDRLIPDDLRMAYRILKNAGYVPPELDTRREASDLRRLLALATGDEERRDISAKLTLLEMRLEAHGRTLPLHYREGVRAKLSGD